MVRHRLLSATHPDRPSGRVNAHLAECAACREWQARLVQVERTVPCLPVPVPVNSARAAFIEHLQGALARPKALPTAEPKKAPAARESVPTLALVGEPTPLPLAKLSQGPRCDPMPKPAPPRRRWRLPGKKPQWIVLGGLAASILLMLSAWWGLPGRPGGSGGRAAKQRADNDPLLANLLLCDLRLAEAGTPRQRIEALADLADGLHVEMRALIPGAETEDVQELARLFDKVIRTGVLPGAKALPPAERQQVLDPIAERLARTGREADELAEDFPAAAGGPLRVVAAAAHDGDGQLRVLLQEAVR
jgi:hypothetical protein